MELIEKLLAVRTAWSGEGAELNVNIDEPVDPQEEAEVPVECSKDEVTHGPQPHGASVPGIRPESTEATAFLPGVALVEPGRASAHQDQELLSQDKQERRVSMRLSAVHLKKAKFAPLKRSALPVKSSALKSTEHVLICL